MHWLVSMPVHAWMLVGLLVLLVGLLVLLVLLLLWLVVLLRVAVCLLVVRREGWARLRTSTLFWCTTGRWGRWVF